MWFVQRPEWAPEDVDMDSASPARVYDALLGGSHNFEVDRSAAENAARLVPDLPIGAAANRRFLRRAVSFLAGSGIKQFMDVGAGIPTVGNTHEIVHDVDPESTVVYVDIDAVAVAHARAILGDNRKAVAVQADLRTPEAMLDEVRATGLIDFSEPVALLMVAVLHLIPDDGRPGEAAAVLRDAVAPGSHLAITHLTSARRPDEVAALTQAAQQRDRISLVFRSPEQVTGFFGDFTLVEPGLSDVREWRPDPVELDAGTAGAALYLAGVGRKD
jgi:S-adenosyl methyltransferase